MIRFYGIQPSEFDGLTDGQKQSLAMAMGQIRAKESLAFICNIGAALSSGRETKEYLIGLANKAFCDDEEARASLIYSVTMMDDNGNG